MIEKGSEQNGRQGERKRERERGNKGRGEGSIERGKKRKRVHRGHRAWRVRKNKESPLITQWGVPRNAYTSVTSLITM